MFMEKNTNIQDEYIEELKKKGANITIFLTPHNSPQAP